MYPKMPHASSSHFPQTIIIRLLDLCHRRKDQGRAGHVPAGVAEVEEGDEVEHEVEGGRPLPRRIVPQLVLEVAVDLPLAGERPVGALGM